MTAPVFVVEQLQDAPEFVLDGPEGRHAVSVKRLRTGEEVVLTDGRGRWAPGAVRSAEGKDRLVVGLEPVREEPRPAVRITVVQALPKGDRGEVAVETMTETGADRIVPWQAARCITQWKGDRGLKSLAKWRNTAREAGKQSRRVLFPDVADLATTKQVAALLAAADFAAVLHEDRDYDSEPLATVALPDSGEIVLVVGPEGGVSPDELAAFAAAGARTCRLGPTVLRTSTAGTAAAALLLGRTGRWS
ncbi:16S rRNA (uracil(1498)-N(3))-methyltransferase [Streptomyces sp. NPDC058369]|uniref:16S rRNA (uracil(1498)-N(3))-methyltransferase n=1 Tax=unclassified Streptomyces TaxID=2593676 RepID=UPI002257E90B|nr:16S rRNA (uracil(1498)-N(3))-methyltransferase [Streptomyces sp. NBC_01789]MCX4449213.1 16S rRNA (uracil(1498)-N(3))-methyltransferase [Streptomyces sp. NBC_01789]